MKKPNKKNEQSSLSTYDAHLANLTPKQRKEYEAGYKKLLASELLIAIIQKKHAHAQKIAQELNLPPTILQQLDLKSTKDYSFQTIVKILKKAGFTQIKVEYEGEDLNIPLFASSKN